MNVLMAIRHNRNHDPRRYNDPLINEVAVVFRNEDGEPPLERDFLIHHKASTQDPHTTTRRLYPTDPMTDPMCYPLLFPSGTEGWKEELRMNVTFLEAINGLELL